MAQVYLSLGSNIDRYQHITAALNALQDAFGSMSISSVYESEAVGFKGSAFLNLVVGLETDWSVGELSRWLKRLEDQNGRKRGGPKFAPRTLDVDILTYDDCIGLIDGVELPRGEILYNAFVLWPLAEIAPNEAHPISKEIYRVLWSRYDKTQQVLAPVEFRWQGRLISSTV
jgi:2-amino-4-hydroxy-6-hydroxymethyldihydropteridine diphosphokinase